LTKPITEKPPILLTSADYYGTLAAARLLGQQGFRVTMAHPDGTAPASWSRYVARRVRCPRLSPPGPFIRWLIEFGRKNPGHLYYPTSDDHAWVIAAHAAELTPYFTMLAPPLASLERLLDKATLHSLCAEAGIETPRAWYPRDLQELERIAGDVTLPVLIKQRTQVLSSTHSKGVEASTVSEMLAGFERFCRQNLHDPAIQRSRPDACRPMIQEYVSGVDDGTLIIAGFADRDGRVLAARAGIKVLQRPRRLGIALCLEEAPLPEKLVAALGRLCRAAGYFGVFHVEFIRAGDRLLLIDFNPRYYHHMSFEIARGMPLPLFVVHAALGDKAALAQLAVDARESAEPAGRAFTHWFILREMVTGQRLFGAMTPLEAKGWRQWARAHRGAMTDAVWDRADWKPWILDSAGHLADWMRHPRAFMRRTLGMRPWQGLAPRWAVLVEKGGK